MPPPFRKPQGRKEVRLPPPLDAAGVERLALRYVERFATTRARLRTYLARKVRERGWVESEEALDLEVLADRLADLGYIDDRAFGEARASAMARRGLGQRRVGGALRAAGLDAQDHAAIAPTVAARAVETALAFARRRRIGPFAEVAAERAQREKQIAAMIRGGHDYALARRIAQMAPGEAFDVPE